MKTRAEILEMAELCDLNLVQEIEGLWYVLDRLGVEEPKLRDIYGPSPHGDDYVHITYEADDPESLLECGVPGVIVDRIIP